MGERATRYPDPRKFSPVGRPRLLGDVESEVADLAVPDDVVLALEPELALRAEVREGPADRHQLLVAVDLGTDEPARDVGVDHPGRVLGPCPVRDRPRPHLVLPDR